jgi:hypothetical protein
MTSEWFRVVLMSGSTSAWLIYDTTPATEAPRQAVAIPQYGLLACALFGSVVMAALRE